VRQDIRLTSLTNQAADPGFLHIAIESTENAFSFTPTFIPRENPNTTKPQPRPEPHPPPSPPSESISSASIQDLVGALACMFPTSSWAAVAFNVLSNDWSHRIWFLLHTARTLYTKAEDVRPGTHIYIRRTVWWPNNCLSHSRTVY
jgi:hypothetical protein